MNALWAVLLAYHSAALFEEDASVGGGGGVLYTGSALSQGLDCGVCHLDAPGEVTLAPTSDPPSLLSEREYVPGEVYDLTIFLQGESRGRGRPGNYNSMAVEIVDAEGERVGGFFGYDADSIITLAGGGALFSRGTRDQTEWSLSWQAPEEGTGYVDFYLVAVDGDGAGQVDQTATDPLGDDVVAGAFRIAEAGIEAPPFDRQLEDEGDGPLGRERDVTGCGIGPRGGTTPRSTLGLLGLVLAVTVRRRRS
jgi:MYXO-CTERM domain-containing protein